MQLDLTMPLQGEEYRQPRLLADCSLQQMAGAWEGAEGFAHGQLLAISYIFAVPDVVDQRILDSKEYQKKDSGSEVLDFDMIVAVSIQDQGESPMVCFESVASTIATTSVA